MSQPTDSGVNFEFISEVRASKRVAEILHEYDCASYSRYGHCRDRRRPGPLPATTALGCVRAQFGPEYQHAVKRFGDERKAEADLAAWRASGMRSQKRRLQ